MWIALQKSQYSNGTRVLGKWRIFDFEKFLLIISNSGTKSLGLFSKVHSKFLQQIPVIFKPCWWLPMRGYPYIGRHTNRWFSFPLLTSYFYVFNTSTNLNQLVWIEWNIIKFRIKDFAANSRSSIIWTHTLSVIQIGQVVKKKCV